MTEELDWPEKGRKAFIPGPCDQSFYPKECLRFSSRALEFRTAAEMILDKCLGDQCRSGNDYLFFPIAYLYRHCIELYLKDIVSTGVGMQFFTTEAVEEALSKHGLAKLWNHAKLLLVHRWPDGDPIPLKAVESVINEFHQVDPSGQVLRYETSKDGSAFRHETLPDQISPDELKKTMSGVCNFLSATSGGLSEDLSNMRDAESQNAPDY